MKKMFFLLIAIAAISFTASSQITLKNLDITGDAATLKTAANVQYLTIKPITHYYIEYLGTDTVITISGKNKQFTFAVSSLNGFTISGAAKPVTTASFVTQLNTVVAASSGGSSTSDASALNQVTGNNLSTIIRDSAIVLPNIGRLTRDRIQVTNDSLAALNNISRQIRDKVNNDQKSIDSIAAGNNVARETRDIIAAKDSTKEREFVSVKNFPTVLAADSLKTRAVTSVLNLPINAASTVVAATAASIPVSIMPNNNTVTSNVGATVYVQSTGNNSTGQLAVAATFTGTIESVLNYPQIIVSIRSGQPFSLVIEQFSDLAGTIALPSITYTRLANEGYNQPITLSGSYYRVKVTNTGLATTTDLFIETWYGSITATPNLTNAGSLPVDIKTQSDYIIGQAAQTAVINNILPPTATANSTDAGGYNSGTTTIVSTGTGGTYIFEGSNDNITFEPLTVKRTTFGNGAIIAAAITATASTFTYEYAAKYKYIRLRIATAITGGNIRAFSKLSSNIFASDITKVSNGIATDLQTAANQAGAWIVGQTPVTQVNDIASAAITTTTSTAAITPTNGVSFVSDINVTAVTGTTPTMQVNIEQSYDGGTTWELLYEYPIITVAGKYTSPRLPISGNRIRYVQTIAGTTPSFTRSIVRSQGNDDVTLAYRTKSQSVTTTITTGGTAQTLFASNPSRQGFEIQNNSAGDLRFSIGGTASATVGFVLTAGGSYSSPTTRTSTMPITIFGATTGQQFTYIQY